MTTRSVFVRAVFSLVGASLAGCVETLPVPPSRLAVHDTPATVGAGNVEVAIGGGLAGSTFNGSASVGTLSVTHGLNDQNDLRFDATVGAIVVDEQYIRNHVSGFALARMGVERNLVPGVVSLIGGIGGGATLAGGFVSVDAGILLGYENRYLSPFAGAVLHVGVPITHPTVRIDYREDGGAISTVYREAYSAFGWVASAGVRLPFGGYRAHAPHPFAFQLSADFGASYGNDPAITTTSRDFVTYAGAQLTFRAILGEPRAPR